MKTDMIYETEKLRSERLKRENAALEKRLKGQSFQTAFVSFCETRGLYETTRNASAAAYSISH